MKSNRINQISKFCVGLLYLFWSISSEFTADLETTIHPLLSQIKLKQAEMLPSNHRGMVAAWQHIYSVISYINDVTSKFDTYDMVWHTM